MVSLQLRLPSPWKKTSSLQLQRVQPRYTDTNTKKSNSAEATSNELVSFEVYGDVDGIDVLICANDCKRTKRKVKGTNGLVGRNRDDGHSPWGRGDVNSVGPDEGKQQRIGESSRSPEHSQQWSIGDTGKDTAISQEYGNKVERVVTFNTSHEDIDTVRKDGCHNNGTDSLDVFDDERRAANTQHYNNDHDHDHDNPSKKEITKNKGSNG